MGSLIGAMLVEKLSPHKEEHSFSVSRSRGLIQNQDACLDISVAERPHVL